MNEHLSNSLLYVRVVLDIQGLEQKSKADACRRCKVTPTELWKPKDARIPQMIQDGTQEERSPSTTSMIPSDQSKKNLFTEERVHI